MNLKAAGYIVAILAVLGFVTGVWYAARSYQRNIDLLAPADTVKHDLPVIRVPLPVERLSPDSANIILIHPKSPAPVGGNRAPAPNQGTVDSLEQVIADLSGTVYVTVHDKEGGTHSWTYVPVTGMSWEYYYPIQIVQPQDILITRNLPAVPEPERNFWAGMDLLWSGTPGVIGHFGFKTVGLSIGNVGDKPTYGIALHFSL